MSKPKGTGSSRKNSTAKKVTEKETDLIRRVTWDRLAKKTSLPQFQVGDTVAVSVKVKEGEKERVQLYTGVVLKIQGSGIGRTFTVRKIASGVGVERTFPIMSPSIEKIEVISRGKVRRARLFYLRGLKGRSARLNTEIYFGETGAAGAADEIAVDASAMAPAAGNGEEKVAAGSEKKAAKAAKAEKTKTKN